MTLHHHYPIVLVHGIFRADYFINLLRQRLRLGQRHRGGLWDQLHYFRGIASFLRHHGYEVYHADLSLAAGVEHRAEQLKKIILKILWQTGHHRVHLIAHSMGGLDARYMIVRKEMASRVASLTTIGTPHWGTPVAEWVLEKGGDRLIQLAQKLINVSGVCYLTREACTRLNASLEEEEARNDVVYYAYSSAQRRNWVFRGFRLSYDLIHSHEGANDGMVSFQSQIWKAELTSRCGTRKRVEQREFPIPADHVDQIGWTRLNDSPFREHHIHEIYLSIVRDLYERFEQYSHGDLAG